MSYKGTENETHVLLRYVGRLKKNGPAGRKCQAASSGLHLLVFLFTAPSSHSESFFSPACTVRLFVVLVEVMVEPVVMLWLLVKY